jgi:hypothetical protein
MRHAEATLGGSCEPNYPQAPPQAPFPLSTIAGGHKLCNATISLELKLAAPHYVKVSWPESRFRVVVRESGDGTVGWVDCFTSRVHERGVMSRQVSNEFDSGIPDPNKNLSPRKPSVRYASPSLA